MGCHFLLQCRKVKSEREVTQSCPTLSDPMDCNPPGSSVHGVFQARVLTTIKYFVQPNLKVFNLCCCSVAKSCPTLCNFMDRGAWWAAVHGVAKSRTRLSDFPFTFHFHALEKEMATQSSVLAWRIPGTGRPGGLPSLGLHRVGHD